MKKWCTFLVAALMAVNVSGCGSNPSISSESIPESSVEESKKILDDADFIVNMGKALDARWALTDSKQYNDEALDSMTAANQQKAYTLFVQTELDILGDYGDYEFSDNDVKNIAQNYFYGLSLQKDGAQYAGTDRIDEWNETFGMGRNYRTVAIHDAYVNYGLTVSKKNQSSVEAFVDDYSEAKESVARQDFVDELPTKLEYKKIDDDSGSIYDEYVAVIENTCGYDIDSLEIDIAFVDASGVILDQTSDYISNFNDGAKYQSKIMYNTENGKFDHMEFTVSMYW